ncbi:streptothricine-acetyl-transferase [Xenorhabdus vietnamensis]|uniref:Streptothricine-acetyl-transferase n=1 Tax=Xenorhabdus vietnamensis TaxID=351656 RepID=A0A1Y2SIM7_9GAMM|nr:GNAT family N-acetyltransferase [Xenorhabdus vietnamensis]OTA18477.1 streptothricine-acetyl-transferase [Xenorhabdus vietnamensis]
MNDKELFVSIGFISQEDYTQWLPHWLSYQEFYQAELTEETTLKTWDRFLAENEPVFCAIAKYGDRVVGFVHYLYHLSTWAEKDYCYLEDLFVADDIRGQHIGKQLIEFVHQEAKKYGCKRLYWHTQETNLRAQKLYNWIAEKSGMIEYRMPL